MDSLYVVDLMTDILRYYDNYINKVLTLAGAPQSPHEDINTGY